MLGEKSDRLCSSGVFRGKKGPKQNSKKVNGGPTRLSESFHHWCSVRVPPQFCQLFGGGGASCWVPSSGCQYGEIWGNAKWADLHEKQLIGTNFPSWIFFFPFFPSNHLRCIEVEMPSNCRPAGNCFRFFHWVTQQSASRLLKKTVALPRQVTAKSSGIPMTQIKEIPASPACFVFVSSSLSSLSSHS